jgi:hypothetical protein
LKRIGQIRVELQGRVVALERFTESIEIFKCYGMVEVEQGFSGRGAGSARRSLNGLTRDRSAWVSCQAEF